MVLLGTPKRIGSITLIGAVSPPGGDFTEPVTTHTMRFIKTFWGLDTKLAYSRHYPAINWMTSYSGYLDSVVKWWFDIDKEWLKFRNATYEILQREDELKEIVRLLGPEALPDEQKLILDVARMIKEGFLQQSAYDEVDSYCRPEKQMKLLRIFVEFYRESQNALKNGVSLNTIRAMPIIPKLIRAKSTVLNEKLEDLDLLYNEMMMAFGKLLTKEVKVVAE